MNAAANGSLVMLLVEDNPADVVFFQEALEATRTPATVHVLDDGDDVMRFLLRRERYADAPRPDVIVLDLNLPIKNGHEVLSEMMADPKLRTIPVAVLTTSTSEGFVCDCCPPGQCLYFTKTADFESLQDIVRRIADHARTNQSQT